MLLLCAHVIIFCISLRFTDYYRSLHILYDPAQLPRAIVSVASLCLLLPAFVIARFSFGYWVSFHFFSMVLGFLWLNCFSEFGYNHQLAAASAALSILVFIVVALPTRTAFKQLYIPSDAVFDCGLVVILLFAAAVMACASVYNFKIMSFAEAGLFRYRQPPYFPAALRYSMGAITSVLLPFAFACFVEKRRYWFASLALALLVGFYPILLMKTVLFTPVWLVILTIGTSAVPPKFVTILSLLLPTLAGILLILIVGEAAREYFYIVNLRMMAIPSSALDVYNDFFSTHPVTYFCQINSVRLFLACPYGELGVEMSRHYAAGNFNASLFATEGIASLGVWLAPVAALLGAVVIAVGNRVSSGLSARFILLSAGVLPQLLLNVPLATVLLTHGMGFLYLLWYITPRNLGNRKGDGQGC
jgi:hypothetical protein